MAGHTYTFPYLPRWLEANQLAEKEELTYQQQELEDICRPIVSKVGGARGCGAAVAAKADSIVSSALTSASPLVTNNLVAANHRGRLTQVYEQGGGAGAPAGSDYSGGGMGGGSGSGGGGGAKGPKVEEVD
jgi:uncharacterized membrane protein YgcG